VDAIEPAFASGHISAPQAKPQNAIELLEGQTVRLLLRDQTVVQGKLERIGWGSVDSEAISYLCVRMDADSVYVLAAQGISTRSGLLFIPWDSVSCLVAP
jgi:hypothetical protein